MSRTTDMTIGNPGKLILKFSWPLILTNMGQQLYMIVDAAIVGRGVGVKALAAVGSADWIYWLILWTVIGLTQGFSVFISRYFGDKNYRDMNRTIAMSTVLCAIIGFIITLAGLMTARPLLAALKTPDDIIGNASVYLLTMTSGTIIVSAYNMASSILRAVGDSKSPLIGMLIAAFLNICLDVIFVMVFRWGVFGAAFASVLSQLVAFFYCFVQIGKIENMKFNKGIWKPDFKMIRKLLVFSIPLSLQYMVIALGGIILQSTITLQGSFFVAGYTAVNKLYGLLECTAISLGTAFSTFFAQNFGASNKERIKEGIKTGIKLCLAASVVISFIILLFGKQMLMLFLDVTEKGGTQAMEIAWRYLWIMALWLAVLYIIYVYRSILQAVGISLWSMVSGFGELAVRVIMGKAVILWLGIDTLFYIEPMAWVAALLFVMIPYYVGKNKYLS